MSAENIMYCCPRCGAVYRSAPGMAPSCGGCKLTAKEIGYGETEWYQKSKEERADLLKYALGQTEEQLAEAERKLYGIITTTTNHVEGYRVTEYIDVCSGTCVLGTGFLSTISAGVADFFGSTSGEYESKLEKAKGMAVRSLKKKAHDLGGDAIIGMDIDYTTFRADVMGVIASGTVVKIEKTDDPA